LGALVIVAHEDDPLTGTLVVPDVLVVPGALVEVVGVVVGVVVDFVVGFVVVVGVEDPPLLPPAQDVVVTAGPLAQAHTAAAEDNTGPSDAAGHPAITQGPAVA
jgi:hypothetical protein